ncbi:MAG: class I SAM-dependent methyltransferase [Pirellulaceae bacterium]|nr:class I SAM-dependent methyltransferase [Pirellulaceae bacterium]
MAENQVKSEVAAAHEKEVQRGERFQFGQNWREFLNTLDDERIAVAEASLKDMLGKESLAGLSFLDIGSGSGLFSLAARRLGARVHSFDYDPESVACTEELRQRYFPEDTDWQVERASVLDRDYVNSLGTFDIVYSWGVLHQTGEMWQALEIVSTRVHEDGKLFISIYNDQGGASNRWRMVKRLYNRSPNLLGPLIVLAVGVYWEVRSFLIRLVRFQNPLPFADWDKKKQARGMSVWHDLVDWVGGYPHEVAKPEQIFDFFFERGFTLMRLSTDGGGHGCNEYVFLKRTPQR